MLRKKNKSPLTLVSDSLAHIHTNTNTVEENYILLLVLLFQSPIIQVLESETVFRFSSLFVSLLSFYYS